MVYQSNRSICEECGTAHQTAGGAELCERRHRIRELISEIVDLEIVDLKHKGQQAVIDFLEQTVDHGRMWAGSATCPHCHEDVHELWEECPHCYQMLDFGVYNPGDQLGCGSCGLDELYLKKKPGVHRGFGIWCTHCGDHTAHVTGIITGFKDNDHHQSNGHWFPQS